MRNPYKLTYHVEPTRGLLNDPNGLIFFKDKYYFFHQWNRFSTDHQYKEWGLFTSSNMIDWTNQGSAILPDRKSDQNGIYSGSGIEHEGQMYLFYTGNVKNEGERKSYQCISTSNNGRTFIKEDYVIETPMEFTEHFRDPKVWKGKNNWWMIVGAQTNERKGAIALYSSNDLLNWKYENILYENYLENMCECPDLFSINEETHILICCPQVRSEDDNNFHSYAAFISGEFNEESKTFLPQTNLELMDHGFDFYAPQSFRDNKGRRIIVGWMSRMTDEEERLCPTIDFGYLHCLTLPRVVTWENGVLKQKPVEEIKQLRKNEKQFNTQKGSFELENGIFEMEVLYKSGTSNLQLSLRNYAIEISYCDQTNIFSVSRENWVTKRREKKEKKIKDLAQLSIFSDSSAMEIFVNDGEAVFSLRYFTSEDNVNVEYSGLGQGGKLLYYALGETKI